MVFSVLVSVDESLHSQHALQWALDNLPMEGTSWHVITIMPPVTYSVSPAAPIATAGAIAAVTHQWDAQRKHDEAEASQTLHAAIELMTHAKVQRTDIHTHALPAAGGASGVAESIVQYALAKKVDMAVLGSRGMGAIKSSLMNIVGLGSVSDYVTHSLHCPVVIVRPEEGGAHVDAVAGPPEHRKLVVALDDSVHSREALKFVLDKVMRPTDDLHLISVAAPVPFPTNTRVQMVDESSAVVAALEGQQWERSKKQTMQIATQLCCKAVDHAAFAGVPKERIFYKALTPEGGASDVGASICHYANESNADLVVVGSRGLGAVKRSMLALIGLGSVGDHCTHHMHCPVMIMKQEEGVEPPSKAHAHAAGGAAAADDVKVE